MSICTIGCGSCTIIRKTIIWNMYFINKYIFHHLRWNCNFQRMTRAMIEEAIKINSFSHSVLWFSLWDVYRYQPISHSRCRLSKMYGRIMSCVTWSCEKIQKLFIFRAICDNTAHVKSICCSLKGSHLIHWTSAVFSHIALQWTPFAYRIHPAWCVHMWTTNRDKSVQRFTQV